MSRHRAPRSRGPLAAAALVVCALTAIGLTVRSLDRADSVTRGSAPVVQTPPTRAAASPPAARPPVIPGLTPRTSASAGTDRFLAPLVVLPSSAASQRHAPLRGASPGARQGAIRRELTLARRVLHRGPTTLHVQMVQANLREGTPPRKFASDVQTVFSTSPDFVTLNEVDHRSDAQITPPGYALYRDPTGAPPARETPVLWRTDTWTEVAEGTRYLSTRHVKWGMRAVNWVTLKNIATGQVVSVVSAHPAPTIPVTRGLLPVFVDGLSGLVNTLGQQGPVFVGGDFNAAYGSRAYPSGALALGGLVPTYATFGRPPGGTGDHHGATIDYVFTQQGHGVTADAQGTRRLFSDHKAVWADFTIPPH